MKLLQSSLEVVPVNNNNLLTGLQEKLLLLFKLMLQRNKNKYELKKNHKPFNKSPPQLTFAQHALNKSLNLLHEFPSLTKWLIEQRQHDTGHSLNLLHGHLCRQRRRRVE